MDAVSTIRKKRDGRRLDAAEIAAFVDAYTRGAIPDYQASALAMAIFFQGLDAAETADLTNAILHSGKVMDFSDIPATKVDKHSTGGVGDKTSLIIAPVAAAAGLAVPMISGRGLGHTGGTLDKLESIPGFRTRLTLDEFHEAVRATGAGLIGQTDELAPADRKLYALRDVTGTVESIPLISASIMSKKLAEGIDALVLDVKVGSGAFMKTREQARELARRLVEIGRACGKRVEALLTAMDQPLGCAVGNALEVIEILEALKGRGSADLMEVSRELTARMFVLGGVEADLEAARAHFDQAIASGAALRKFAEIVRGQGGEADVIEDYARLPLAAHEESIAAWDDGYVAALEAEAIGLAAVRLGAGRERLDTVIDPAVGMVFEKKVGDRVETGERICGIYANDRSRLAEVRAAVRAAIRISPEPVPAPPLILESILE
ncbi:MAG TPA: thymidine phosphorylase [Terriglobia bacterium]|nr:thymidine phosphorylase [Terriglobia bacterium]